MRVKNWSSDVKSVLLYTVPLPSQVWTPISLLWLLWNIPCAKHSFSKHSLLAEYSEGREHILGRPGTDGNSTGCGSGVGLCMAWVPLHIICSINILFYVCSRRCNIRPKQKQKQEQHIIIIHTNFATELGTIDLTILVITSVLYKIFLTLL